MNQPLGSSSCEDHEWILLLMPHVHVCVRYVLARVQSDGALVVIIQLGLLTENTTSRIFRWLYAISPRVLTYTLSFYLPSPSISHLPYYQSEGGRKALSAPHSSSATPSLPWGPCIAFLGLSKLGYLVCGHARNKCPPVVYTDFQMHMAFGVWTQLFPFHLQEKKKN